VDSVDEHEHIDYLLKILLPAALSLSRLRNEGCLMGFFLLHVNNKVYGIRDPEATLLGCSFDEVSRRIKMRGAV